jgi:hypothetical protein
MTRRIPALLVAGLVATAIADGAMPVLSHALLATDVGAAAWQRLTLLACALDLVAVLMLAGGAAALRDVVAGAARRGAAVAAIAFAIGAAAETAAMATELVAGVSAEEGLVAIAAQIARLVGFGALLAAGTRRRDPRSALLALGAAATAVMGWPLSPLHRAAMADAIADPSAVHTGYLVVVGVGLELLVLAAVRQASRPAAVVAAPSWPCAQRGLVRAAAALAARAIVVALAVPCASLVPAAGVIAVAALLATGTGSALLATGAARVSRWGGPAVPAGRFAVAAVVHGASAAFQLGLALTLLRDPARLVETDLLVDFAGMLVLVPAVDLAGLLVLAAALTTTAHRTSLPVAARRLPIAAVALALAAALATWLLDLAASGHAAPRLAPTAIAVAAAVALLTLARAALVLALGGRDTTTVPAAIARKPQRAAGVQRNSNE